MILYQLDKHAIWTGETQTVSDKAPIPRGWTHHAPPDVPAGQMAQRRGDAWVLIDTVPQGDLQRELAEARAAKRAEIIAERDRRLYPGRLDTSIAPVDLRNARDEANLTLIRGEARERQSVNDITPIPFRDADNVSQMLAPAQVITMTDEVLGYGQQVYATSWQLKDQLQAIFDDEQLTLADKRTQMEAVVWPE